MCIDIYNIVENISYKLCHAEIKRTSQPIKKKDKHSY